MSYIFTLRFKNGDSFAHTYQEDSNYIMDIPVRWGYIKEGWKTQSQVDIQNTEALSLNRPITEKGEERVVIDSKIREVIVDENFLANNPDFEYEINTRVINNLSNEITEYYYTIPEVSHLEWYCPANYTIEIEDTLSYEYKIEHYSYLRAAAYPDFKSYLDAKVKQASNDPALKIEGQEQEAKYISDCLLVKQAYPKA